MRFEVFNLRVNASFLLVSICLVLFGCVQVGPDYEKPDIRAPDHWRITAQLARDTTNIEWWRSIGDPVLNRLIDEAVKNNLDIKVAVANAEIFMGRYGAVRSVLFPQIYGGGTYQHIVTSGSESGTLNDLPYQDRDHALLGGTLSWEIDLWGQLRRAKEAANADLYAQIAARDAVVLSIASLVAETYVALLAIDEQIFKTNEFVLALEKEVKIADARRLVGYSSGVEATQARSELERRKALKPQFERLAILAEHALCFLMGKDPGPIKRGKRLTELSIPPIPAGLPADLLKRRPDIRQAEENLIAANARVGVATGEYFPKLVLTGAGGQASQSVDQLLMPGATFWTVGMQLVGPIITAGKIAGQVQSAEGARQAALMSYRTVILKSFREFEDALISRQKALENLDRQTARLAADKKYFRLSKLKFQEGFTEYLVVLDSLRQSYESTIALISAKNDTFLATIQLYKAMGGGWVQNAQLKANTDRPRDATFLP